MTQAASQRWTIEEFFEPRRLAPQRADPQHRLRAADPSRWLDTRARKLLVLSASLRILAPVLFLCAVSACNFFRSSFGNRLSSVPGPRHRSRTHPR
jgi:hypothetical protein